MTRRFVLLDRDGTINEEVGYVMHPDELTLIPGSREALREIQGVGLGLVVVTNQTPVGRGAMSAAKLDAIHARLRELLAAGGVSIDGIEVCPHRRDEGCDCRKPATGLVERAARMYGFDPAHSWVVGDHTADMLLGRAVGARTILVRTGHGEQELSAGAGAFAHHVVAGLPEAAALIRDEVLAGAGR